MIALETLALIPIKNANRNVKSWLFFYFFFCEVKTLLSFYIIMSGASKANSWTMRLDQWHWDLIRVHVAVTFCD